MKILTRCLRRSQPIPPLGGLVCVLALAGSLFAQADPDWTEPFTPFRVTSQ